MAAERGLVVRSVGRHDDGMTTETTESAPPQPQHQQQAELDRQALCEYQLRMTLDFVQMADRKARFLMRIGLGLFAATFIGLPPSISALKQSLAGGGLGDGSLAAVVIFIVVIVLYSVCVTCLVVAMMKVIGVVRPRILSDAEASAPSPFFFQSIARMDLQRYKQLMRNLKPEHVVEEMTTMIYQNSLVADAKFRKLDQAVRWMLGGGLIGFVFALVVIVSVQLL